MVRINNIHKLNITRLTAKEKVLELANSNCGKCGSCCSYGSGFLVGDDMEKIAKHLELKVPDLKHHCLEEVELFNTKRCRPRTIKNGKPYGMCIFYNAQEGCTIHGIKPLHCRVGSCSEYGEQLNEWFILNYFVNPDDPQSIREWAVRLKTHPTIPGGELHELVPDRESLKKMLDNEV